MPRYDYRCQDCGEIFEVKLSYEDFDKVKPVCPLCASKNTERLFGFRPALGGASFEEDMERYAARVRRPTDPNADPDFVLTKEHVALAASYAQVALEQQGDACSLDHHHDHDHSHAHDHADNGGASAGDE